MKAQDFRPLALLFGYRSGKKMIFIGRQGEIVLTGLASVIVELLKHCNGLRTISEIKERMAGNSKKYVDELVKVLLHNNIICDSRSVYKIFHCDSINPRQFSYDWTDDDVADILKLPKKQSKLLSGRKIFLMPAKSNLLDLIRHRCTVRNFKPGKISTKKISGLLESIYGLGKSRSVPSAGGLYPLEIYVAILRGSGNIGRGWYQYDSENRSLLCLEKSSSVERVNQILDSSEVLNNAQAVIFFGADLSRTTLKYSNRGYRFVQLEVGHAAQNANLYCVENGLGAVEWGGYNDLLIARELKLDYPEQAILLAMVVGIPADKERNLYKDKAYNNLCKLKRELVGAGKPIKWIRLGAAEYKDYVMPRFVGTAKFASKRRHSRNFSFASGKTTAETSIKVIAEAYERYASGIVRIDKVSSAKDLDAEFLDPRSLTPLSVRQSEIFNLLPFSLEKEWQWVEGTRLSDKKKVYVTVDNAFYPISRSKVGRRLCYYSNSSGVAAHISPRLAVKNALFELIERDAIAVGWYSKRSIFAIPHTLVEEPVLERLRFWVGEGRCVKFLNFTLDSIPVVVSVIYSDQEKPFLIAGAAAAASLKEAVTKSFNEAEFMLLSWRKKATQVKMPELREVVSPREHGVLYFFPEQKAHVSWLLNAKEKEPEARSLENDLLSLFDPVAVNITPLKVKSSLFVFRVLSNRLLPLNFGYRTEHYLHPRLKMLGLKWSRNFPAQPHFFA
jgi:thiazole/oxazole-forming peptide maturase SagD family component